VTKTLDARLRGHDVNFPDNSVRKQETSVFGKPQRRTNGRRQKFLENF